MRSSDWSADVCSSDLILVAPEIAQQRAHFVQLQVERVGRVWLPLGHAVDDFARIFFGAKRTEQAIPDDQHTAEVAVDLRRIGAVMDAMMRRRVEHGAEAVEDARSFGVQEELGDRKSGV